MQFTLCRLPPDANTIDGGILRQTFQVLHGIAPECFHWFLTLRSRLINLRSDRMSKMKTFVVWTVLLLQYHLSWEWTTTTKAPVFEHIIVRSMLWNHSCVYFDNEGKQVVCNLHTSNLVLLDVRLPSAFRIDFHSNCNIKENYISGIKCIGTVFIWKRKEQLRSICRIIIINTRRALVPTVTVMSSYLSSESHMASYVLGLLGSDNRDHSSSHVYSL